MGQEVSYFSQGCFFSRRCAKRCVVAVHSSSHWSASIIDKTSTNLPLALQGCLNRDCVAVSSQVSDKPGSSFNCFFVFFFL